MMMSSHFFPQGSISVWTTTQGICRVRDQMPQRPALLAAGLVAASARRRLPSHGYEVGLQPHLLPPAGLLFLARGSNSIQISFQSGPPTRNVVSLPLFPLYRHTPTFRAWSGFRQLWGRFTLTTAWALTNTSRCECFGGNQRDGTIFVRSRGARRTAQQFCTIQVESATRSLRLVPSLPPAALPPGPIPILGHRFGLHVQLRPAGCHAYLPEHLSHSGGLVGGTGIHGERCH